MGKTLIDERYELLGLVGRGGMAYVYLAHDEVLDRDVALKVLKDHYAHDEKFVERFRREARSAASLSHPHIVPVLDSGETEDGTYYIAMEYLPGGTLKDHILKRGALPPQAAMEVALQTTKALRAAHVRGIVHRDVKSRNILVTASGDVKVADFGIARAAEATTTSDLGEILGSAKYMSPEQAAGEQVGPASDLYSLGVVLYEMLTGRVPFEVEIPADVSVEHAGGPPPHPREVNPDVPEGTDALVMKLLATDPEDRYGSATQLIKDLRRVRDGLSPVGSSGDDATTAALGTPAASILPASAPDGSRARRKTGFSVLAAFVLLALLGTVGGAAGWNLLRDPGAASIPEILKSTLEGPPAEAVQKPSVPEDVPEVVGLTEQEARERVAGAGFETEVRPRKGPEEDVGRVLEQSVPNKKGAEDPEILLTVGEAPEVARVPNLVGLSYPEAENKLEEAGFLLGGVQEAPSDGVPAGVIMKQDTPASTTQEAGTYVYLTTSLGPSEGSGASGNQEPVAIPSQNENGQWKLGEQISAQGATEPQPDRSPTPSATPTASSTPSPIPPGDSALPVSEEGCPVDHLVKGTQPSRAMVRAVDVMADAHLEKCVASVQDAEVAVYGHRSD
jgi:eukaryotic-like serine/threonine-protein kinase